MAWQFLLQWPRPLSAPNIYLREQLTDAAAGSLERRPSTAEPGEDTGVTDAAGNFNCRHSKGVPD